MEKAEVKGPIEGEVQVVAFKLRDEEYGFDILNVKEIKGLTDIKGVINLRGSVLPVIDLKRRLALMDTPYTSDTRIIIVKSDEIEVGMIVDAVTEVITLKKENIDEVKAVSNERSHFIRGIGKTNDRLIIMLNLEEIIGVVDETK